MEVLVPSQSILEKLQLRDEKSLLIQGLPSTIEKQFVKLSFAKNITPLLKIKKIDFALVFAISKIQLKDILKDVMPSLKPNAKLWIAYPKVTSKIVSDISRDCSWECVAHLGLESGKMISLDPVWCAIKFHKIENLRYAIIQDSEQYHYRDSEARTITPPLELNKLLSVNIEAKEFFDTLSFNNKKEYIIWITGAKKEETKQARLEATIEKLNCGFKNPSEK